jgi:hypothetical protein
MTNTAEQAARATNAAETKQFWYPRLVIHGVILPCLLANRLALGELDLPIANCKRHGVSNENDRRDSVAADIVVAINQIIDADDQPHHTRGRQSTHGKD